MGIIILFLVFLFMIILVYKMLTNKTIIKRVKNIKYHN